MNPQRNNLRECFFFQFNVNIFLRSRNEPRYLVLSPETAGSNSFSSLAKLIAFVLRFFQIRNRHIVFVKCNGK